MKKLAIVCLLILIGCAKEGQEKVSTSNDNFEVTLLFVVDGCKVYRFYDSNTPRYFTVCKNSSVSWEERQGKITVPYSIETK